MNINKELEKYILEHIEPEGEILKELNRKTYLKFLNPRMLSGHLQGKVLKMLSKMICPENILEIGTYTGYSAICLVQGLKTKGKLHTIEINDELEDFIKSYFKKAKVSEKIILHIGDALKIIPSIDKLFDMVFIDGYKEQYLDYYNCVFEKVKKGGFIIADNVLWDGKVIEKVNDNDVQTKGILAFNDFVHNDNRVENVIFPIRDGFMILKKK
ncbi:MAG: O-methyltransferase [Bacteroidales bacterium]|nr:O-methyltransferase [Bacteroidales bacterium]